MSSGHDALAACYPSISIVIVTWNKRHDVINLLDSLLPIAGDDIRVIVVDNASTDGSVEAIKKHPLSVTLLENLENLGGTGGFNTGIRYALENFEQDYIWLLDNDAEVKPDTLEKLVSVMEADNSIGIAGSCILDAADRGLIVETGGYVDERTATWKPHLRYQPHSLYSGSSPVDVDYVPACSALVRKDVFDAIGIMDERYFLHWDDVDFGRAATEAGFRVVAVFDSMVHHGTEKGYSNAVLYFDVRNSLLFLAKHLSALKRVLPMFRVCLRSIMAAKMFDVLGEKLLCWYLLQALDNFISGRFGSSPQPSPQLAVMGKPDFGSSVIIPESKRIVLFAVGAYSDIMAAAGLIRTTNPFARVTLAAPVDRLDAYRSCDKIDNFLGYDLARGGLWGSISFVVEMLKYRFDCAVTAGSGFVVPFAFFVRRHIVVTEEGRSVYDTDVCLKSLWKLPYAVASAISVSLLTFIKCWQAGRRISKQCKMEKRRNLSCA